MQYADHLITMLATFLATVLGGILLRKFRPRGRIGVSIFDYIPLVNRMTSTITDLSITYRGAPISRNLVFVRGIVSNSGDKDIMNEMIRGEIVLKLPGNGKWLDASTPTNDINMRCIPNRSNLAFDFDMLQSGEHASFTALIEWNNDHQMSFQDVTAMQLASRIAGVKNEGVTHGILDEGTRGYLLMHTTLLILITTFISFMAWDAFRTSAATYQMDINGRPQEVEFIPNADRQVDIVRIIHERIGWGTTVYHDLVEKVEASDLFRTDRRKITVNVDEGIKQLDGSIGLVLLALWILVGGLWLIRVIRRYIRMRRLGRALEEMRVS
jgi:hypothetical protein